MKRMAYLVLLAFFASQAASKVPIFEDVLPYSFQNFDECNMRKNGETLVIEKFIKPKDVVFDVGANIGEWSSYVRTRVGDVTIYAFEPIQRCYHELKRKHSYRNMHMYNFAISNEIGSTPFYYYSYNEGCSGFTERKILGNVSDIFHVPTKTLDIFCKEMEINHIDFLKIDTEGAELKVLQGARGMLRGRKIDKIQFEYGGTYPDAGITFKEVFDLLSESGYKIFREHPRGLIKIDKWTEQRENGLYTNYFAVSDLAFLEE